MRFFLMIFVLAFCVVVNYRSAEAAVSGDWGYKTGFSFKDPANWKNIPGSSCGGLRQSPIDINTNSVEVWPALKPVSVIETNASTNTKVSIKKKDSGLELSFNNRWKIRFGNDGCLQPISIHWHWGSDNSKGSEHTKNGRAYPIEGHLVSYNCDIYNSTEYAVKSPSGLYVIGVFYEVGEANQELTPLVNSFESVKASQSVEIDEIIPRSFLPKDLTKYYRYEGSLTTPPCTENVIWTVMDDVLTISQSQLDAFRSFQFGGVESGQLVNNFRPTVPFVDSSYYIKRVVYMSYNGSSVLFVDSLIIYLVVALGRWLGSSL